MACLALAACQSAPRKPRLLAPDSVSIRTDPPGARCTIGYGAVVLATAASTPASIDVPREVACSLACKTPEHGAPACTLDCPVPGLDRPPSVELACSKDGYLDYRMPLTVGWKTDVDAEEGMTVADFGEGVAVTAALVGALALPAAAPALATFAP